MKLREVYSVDGVVRDRWCLSIPACDWSIDTNPFLSLVDTEICSSLNRGKAQSPVNIDPGSIVYDPTLTQLHTDKYIIPIKMENTGQVKNNFMQKVPDNI